jgi:hypothetical protein
MRPTDKTCNQDLPSLRSDHEVGRTEIVEEGGKASKHLWRERPSHHDCQRGQIIEALVTSQAAARSVSCGENSSLRKPRSILRLERSHCCRKHDASAADCRQELRR